MIYMIIWSVMLIANIFLGINMGDTKGEKIYVSFCLQFATTMIIAGAYMVSI